MTPEPSKYLRSKLLNDPPDLVTHRAAEEFVRRVQIERTKGYGFVPFIGAGFSAPSGAPIVKELKPYLQRCICLALGAEPSYGNYDVQPWNPRTDQWPPFIDRARQMVEEDHWFDCLLTYLIKRRGKDGKDRAGKEEMAVIVEGLGAAAEWRTALLFLSRIHRPLPRKVMPQPAVLGTPQQETIDSCFREVLKEKYPGLGHTMLAVLAGALRLDLVLTTNFDDLLERAFAAARNPLDIFDVPVDGDLPHWSALSDVRSLIKMHGNRSSLRANYTLDGPPSEIDKQRFLEYLLSGAGRSEFGAARPEQRDQHRNLDFQNHLLMMGFSAKETRTKAFVEYAFTRMHKDFKVFWICYSAADVQAIHELTNISFQDVTGAGSAGEERSIILRHPHAGHVLLQLYQTIRKNLPPIGSLFPSVSRLTLPPLESEYVRENLYSSNNSKREPPESWKAFRDSVKKHLKDFDDNPDQLQLVIAYSHGDARGVTSACSEVFQEIESDKVCLWLDMNDISSADNLFEVLLESAYFRLGLENWTPVYLERDALPRAAEIDRLANSINKKWVIFLNARETPGANTDDTANESRPHGWMDDDRHPNETSDASNNVHAFKKLITALCATKSKQISVVLLCRNPGPDIPPLLRVWQNEPRPRFAELHAEGKPWFTEDDIVANALQWTARRNAKKRFLHALVLMQRPRLLATIWSEAVSLPGESEENDNERVDWVAQLEQCGLVRRKAGGFIWLHARCRAKLRRILENPQERRRFIKARPSMGDLFQGWSPEKDEEEIHVGLAAWYEKILDASESPAAVFETIHHLCMAARISLSSGSGSCQHGKAACKGLDAASALLAVNSFLIQTHGYSRGSCRRLEYIRDNLCKEILERGAQAGLEGKDRAALVASSRRLQVVCTEVMRAIAREVGEDSKAYARHRQFAFYHARGEWSPKLEEDLCEPVDARYAISKMLFDSLKEVEGDGTVSRCNPEWLRWWRWCGTLAIGSRCYGEAKTALQNALQCIRGGIEFPQFERGLEWNQLVETALATIDQTAEPGSNGLRIETLRIIEQYVAMLLLEDSVSHRLAGLQNSLMPPDQAASSQPAQQLRIRELESKIAQGMRLVGETRSRDRQADSRTRMQANWCESRLLMHQSVCASRRTQLDINAKGRALRTAMGVLSDAEAGLRNSDTRRYRSELVMIELHRAEARLREAESVKVCQLGNGLLSLAQICRQGESFDPKGLTLADFEMRKNFPARYSLAPNAENLRRARSLVADGLRFLNRAEPVLRDRRRNVWWTTWYFERRLRSIALSVWASVFETNSPIPFLGLEAAPRMTDTAADLLLDDSARMIRTDAYRFATIVDAYASCAKALQLRLALDTTCVPLPGRRRQMQSKLQDAIRELNKIRHRRTNPSIPGWVRNAKMDEQVERYVDQVQQHASMILGHLGEGL